MTTAFRLKLLPFLFHTSQLADDVNTRIYGLALITLCRTKYKALQDLCMSIIDKQPVPVGPLAPSSSGNTGEDIWMNIRNTVEEREENRKRMGAVKNVAGLLGRLCAVLMASETPVVPVAILHFELLVACVVSSGARPLKELQFTLRLLLSSCGEFAGLKGSGPLSLENLFAYLETGRNERRTRGDMLRIMQYVADFCDHGLGPDQAPDELSGDSRKDAKQAKVDWHTKLVELKNAYKPGAARIEHSNPGDAASSSSSNRDGSVSREAVANSP
ncbi:hypothetical protein FRC08_005523 [Ceratobasidium sp. 394]|nr:hypothetical protein FRC08_005523 [Ceratobasidium sp. 394]